MNLHGIVNGVTAGGAFFAATVVDQNSLIPIGTAMAVLGGVWWLGRKLQALEDSQQNLQNRIENLPCVGKKQKDCP